MDKSHQYGFSNKAFQIQVNGNPQPREIAPIVSTALTPQEQAILFERFKQFIQGMYTANESYSNLLLNMVADQNCNNQNFSTAVTTYLTFCATLKKMSPNDFAQNTQLHQMLAKVALYRVPEVTEQQRFWLQSGNAEVTNWLNQEINTIKSNTSITQISEATKAVLAKKQASSGIGFGGGSGMGMPNSGMNAGMGMPNNSGMGMPSNSGMGMNQQTNSLADTMGLSNNKNTQQTTMQQAPAPQPQSTPTPTKQTTYTDGHRLYGDESDASYLKLLPKQPNVIGGWAVNPQEPYDVSDVTKFDKFTWSTKYGLINQNATAKQITLADMGNLVEKHETTCENITAELLIKYPDLDTLNKDSEGYDEWVTSVVDYERDGIKAIRDAELGLFLGTSDICGIGTKPWGMPISILDAALEIFGEKTLDFIEDSLKIVHLFGREYIIIDSSDPVANEIVVSRRTTQYRNRRSKCDNRSVKGHYYLINHYASDVGDSPVIEDFYEGDKIVNPDNYELTDHSKVGLKQDHIGEDGKVEVKDVELPASKFPLIDPQLKTDNIGLIETAELVRSECARKRHGEWGNGVIHTFNQQYSFHYNISKKDKAFFADLIKLITDGAIKTLTDLGDYLLEQREAGNLTLNAERFIDGRLMKELNILFNDVLMFEGLIIDNSFIDEYVELIEFVDASDTPSNIKKLFGEREAAILELLVPFDLDGVHADVKKQLLAIHKESSPYRVTTNQSGGNIYFDEASEPHKVTETTMIFQEATSVYVLPNTMMELGLNPHGGILSVPWSVLDPELVELLRLDVGSAAGSYQVALVTKDNYAIRVSGTKDDLLTGTLSILV